MKIDAKKVGMLFPMGDLYITRGAKEVVSHQDVQTFMTRHQNGDWGLVGPEDWEANEQALVHGLRLLSIYRTTDQEQLVWVITEADRSATTVLLPEEY
jgi:hypothetical protein